MVEGDRVEDHADESPFVGGLGLVRTPGRPEDVGQADHLRANGCELALRAGEQRLGAGRRITERMDELLVEERRAQEAFALGRGHDDIAQVRLERLESDVSRLARHEQSGQHRGVWRRPPPPPGPG